MDLTALKILRIMQLTAIILFFTCFMQVSAKTYSQITLQEKNTPIEKVFEKIQKQSGFVFWYEDKLLEKARLVDISVENATLEQTLQQLFKDQPLNYSIVKNTIVVKHKQTPALQSGDISTKDALSTFFPPPPIDISGRVTDADGNPLQGANVKVKGTTQGTTTDANGVFVLKGVDENATLEVSYAEYEMTAIKVNNKTSITVALKQQISSMNEVVINKGYYTEKQRYSVGNVTKITAKDIEKQPVNNPLLALQGRIPGMVITQVNGLAGSGVTVRIQGQNSLSRGTDPFYIIDGVPYSSLTLPSLNNILGQGENNGAGYIPNGAGNPLSYINPADIESIEVLKDADATAIYGSRAANGAILITTKKRESWANKSKC